MLFDKIVQIVKKRALPGVENASEPGPDSHINAPPGLRSPDFIFRAQTGQILFRKAPGRHAAFRDPAACLKTRL